MARIQMLKQRIQVERTETASVYTSESRRMTGRKLQSRRLRIWTQDPRCADCRRVVAYPHGFELDHKVALCHGGADTNENCQVLCPCCHEAKTARDLRG